MSETQSFLTRRSVLATSATAGIALSVFGGITLAQQDKYTVQTPNGLAFSEFRGYEDWQVVAVSQTEDLLKVEVANPVMIAACDRSRARSTTPRMARNGINIAQPEDFNSL